MAPRPPASFPSPVPLPTPRSIPGCKNRPRSPALPSLSPQTSEPPGRRHILPFQRLSVSLFQSFRRLLQRVRPKRKTPTAHVRNLGEGLRNDEPSPTYLE